MVNRTSSLIVRLVDQVTNPARAISRSLLGLNNQARGGFAAHFNRQIESNNRVLDAARGRFFDAAAGGWALKTAFDATAGAAMSLEEKMADIAKVSGMNGGELRGFETTLRNLARNEIPLAVEELAELSAAASQSGIANNDLEEFTRMAAKTAVAWDMSGGQAGESLAKIKMALGLTIEETRAYGDAINFLSDSTASSASDLVEFSRRVAADGKVAGFSNEQVLALGAAMISTGQGADVAATSLRNAGRMLSRGDFGAKTSQINAFRQLGLDAEKVAQAMQVDASGTLLEVLEQIDKAAPHQKLALMSGVFGDEAQALMPLLTELEKTRQSLAAVGDETNYLGSVQREFEVRSQTGRYALQRFKNQLRDVAIVIGQALLPGMKELLSTMAPYIGAISDAAASHPKLVAGIAAAAGGLVAFRVAMAGLSFIGLLGKGGALSMLAFGFNTVGRAAIGAGKGARGALALQAALGAMSGQKLTGLQTATTALRGMALAVPGVGAIGTALTAVGTAVAAISAPVWLGIAAGVAVVAGVGFTLWKYWDRVSSVVGGFVGRLGELATEIPGVKPTLEAFSAVGRSIGDGWGFAMGKLNEFGAWVGSFFQREILTEDQKAGWAEAGSNAADSLVNSVKAVIQGMIDWFKGLPEMIVSAIGSIDIGSLISWPQPPEWLSRLWNGEANAAGTATNADGSRRTAPGPTGHRANGGNVWAGGSFLVGENEPEIFSPKSGGTITPLSQAGGGGRPIHIEKLEIHESTNPQATARAVAEELERMARGAHSDSEAWA